MIVIQHHVQFLTREIDSRLGCGPRGKEDIKTHPFFAGLDWDALAGQQLPAPFVPNTKGKETINFDPEFTQEQPLLTPSDAKLIASINQVGGPAQSSILW